MKPRGRARSGTSCALLGTVIAFVIAGCGSSGQATNATAARSSSAGTMQGQLPGLSTKPATPRFLLEVNTVCRTVRQGAPRPVRAPFTPSGLQRYAVVAEPATRRTLVSLQRLATTRDGAKLQAIASGYTQLQAAYASVGALAHTPRLAHTLGAAIESREQLVTATAQAAGAPACGVAGR